MMRLPSSVATTAPRDLAAALVVFLVALPLCLGIALASNAPPFAGLIAGIVGGILVGFLSGSQTSVSGPAAGLTAVVAAQIMVLGSFQTFLLAVVLAGIIQIGMGVARAGFLADFFPSSVIKGLLAAIGVILILKQIPHLLGHDSDPEGDLAFRQPDNQTTFSELFEIVGDLHVGTAIIGILSVAMLVAWDRTKALKKLPVPAPFLVVLFGVGLSLLFRRFVENWTIGPSHLVQVPVADSIQEFLSFLQFPDFTQWQNPKVYTAAITIAAVASLETMLNLQAVDKIDPQQRVSPPSRELWAQGVGNLVSGLVGGLPVTSVIVRSSVNITSGARTKLATMFHGILLIGCVAFLAEALNLIPLSCLAAILIVTGIKLASPVLVRQMWSEGKYQFAPFIITVIAIVLTDLVVGVLIGLVVSLGFILFSNLRRPIHMIIEKHLGGDVVKVELANQVSFLSRAALARTLDKVPAGGNLLLDATHTDYVDPDVLDMIRDFKNTTGPARGIQVSLIGFRRKYQLHDQIQYVDYTTRELQSAITPIQVLDILKSGFERFRTGQQLTRHFGRPVPATASGEHPLALVISCSDSAIPAELIFDVGVGEIVSVRISGPVISGAEIGSVEYGCAIAGAKLIVVLGHTRCGALNAAVDDVCAYGTPISVIGSRNLGMMIEGLRKSIDLAICEGLEDRPSEQKAVLMETVSRRNVTEGIDSIVRESKTLAGLVRKGQVVIVGAMFDDVTGNLEFFEA